jgi:hypothetical protein
MHDEGESALERKRAGGGVKRVRVGGYPRNVADARDIAAELVGKLSNSTRPRELIDALNCYAKLAELADIEKRLDELEGAGDSGLPPDPELRKLVLQATEQTLQEQTGTTIKVVRLDDAKERLAELVRSHRGEEDDEQGTTEEA